MAVLAKAGSHFMKSLRNRLLAIAAEDGLHDMPDCRSTSRRLTRAPSTPIL